MINIGVPIQLKCINKELLDESEVEWINNYHKWCYEKLTPFLNEEEIIWLKNYIKKI
jgi:Xaa-Pro aminopeptidase